MSPILTALTCSNLFQRLQITILTISEIYISIDIHPNTYMYICVCVCEVGQVHLTCRKQLSAPKFKKIKINPYFLQLFQISEYLWSSSVSGQNQQQSPLLYSALPGWSGPGTLTAQLGVGDAQGGVLRLNTPVLLQQQHLQRLRVLRRREKYVWGQSEFHC